MAEAMRLLRAQETDTLGHALFGPDFLERALRDCTLKSFTDTYAALLVALPEMLLHSLACARNRKKCTGRGCPSSHDNLTPELLNALTSLNGRCGFLSLQNPAGIESVLLAHSASAIGDWIGFLADIGRASRASMVLNRNLEVMLAGVSWMYDNRSIRQFADKSLSEQDIEHGLCLNVDKKKRLYAALGISANVKEISRYSSDCVISGFDLQAAAAFFMKLARELFGVEEGKLSSEQIAAFSRKKVGASAGTSNKAQDAEVLTRVARQFCRIEEDVFRYVLSQWQAQKQYRGKSLKCAVYSERPFDTFLDGVADYFDPHGNFDPDRGKAESPQLSAAYFPHYRIGKFRLLPYNPLSLDALRFNNHHDVQKSMCSLDGYISQSEVANLLSSTPVLDRNRLLADVASFLALCQRRVPEAVTTACARLGIAVARDVFSFHSEDAMRSWDHENEQHGASDICLVWREWLDSCRRGSGSGYVPLHIKIMLHDKWEEEELYKAALVILLARGIYQELTCRNWLLQGKTTSNQKENENEERPF